MIVLIDNQTGMIAGYDTVSRSPVESARHADRFIEGRRHVEVAVLAEMEAGYVGYVMPECELRSLMHTDEFEAADRVRAEGRLIGAVRFATEGVFVPPTVYVETLAA